MEEGLGKWIKRMLPYYHESIHFVKHNWYVSAIAPLDQVTPQASPALTPDFQRLWNRTRLTRRSMARNDVTAHTTCTVISHGWPWNHTAVS